MIAFALIVTTLCAGWFGFYPWLAVPPLVSVALAIAERWAVQRKMKREWDEDGLSPNMRAVMLKEAIGSVGCVFLLTPAAFYLGIGVRHLLHPAA